MRDLDGLAARCDQPGGGEGIEHLGGGARIGRAVAQPVAAYSPPRVERPLAAGVGRSQVDQGKEELPLHLLLAGAEGVEDVLRRFRDGAADTIGLLVRGDGEPVTAAPLPCRPQRNASKGRRPASELLLLSAPAPRSRSSRSASPPSRRRPTCRAGRVIASVTSAVVIAPMTS